MSRKHRPTTPATTSPADEAIRAHRASRFLDQRLTHARSRGQKSVSLFELQAGFRGYQHALDKKAKKYAADTAVSA